MYSISAMLARASCRFALWVSTTPFERSGRARRVEDAGDAVAAPSAGGRRRPLRKRLVESREPPRPAGVRRRLTAHDDALERGQLQPRQRGRRTRRRRSARGRRTRRGCARAAGRGGPSAPAPRRARARDAEPGRDELRDVAHHYRHAVARLDAPGAQRAATLRLPACSSPTVDVAPGAAQQHVAGVALDRRIENRRQRGGNRVHRRH